MGIHVEVIKEQETEADWRFAVEVGPEADKIGFGVTLDREYWHKLTGGRHAPEALVRHTFDFLLSRESRTSILRSFDLREVRNFYPEYEFEMQSIFHA